ncbi:hypothetical protein AAMO2058_001546500, partial [Amorphochlora amoebiformis]
MRSKQVAKIMRGLSSYHILVFLGGCLMFALVTSGSTVERTNTSAELYEVRSRLQKAVEDLNSEYMAQTHVKAHPPTKKLPTYKKLRILVTGGAGFVGSNLVDLLMRQGHEVIVVDNFFTGRKDNVQHWIGHPNFELRHHDVCQPLFIEVDRIYHLASPASPPHYMYNPIKTIKTNTEGTQNMLGIARRVKARMLFTSTSEVYGDPKEHPQRETYWGNVNPIGPRACYDEAKRLGETMMLTIFTPLTSTDLSA